MVLINQSGTETLAIGSPAPAFELPATDGQTYSLESFEGSKAIVVAFTCNHCPYAQANEGRFKELVSTYEPQGVAFLAINPNNAETHPDDSFDKMKVRAEEQGFNYPYLRDESQEVARAYGAVCTPHYFILGADHAVLYEGRLDDNWQEPDKVQKRELAAALDAILAGEELAEPQTNPMGCSIKWK